MGSIGLNVVKTIGIEQMKGKASIFFIILEIILTI
jgi:hypothetical protein